MVDSSGSATSAVPSPTAPTPTSLRTAPVSHMCAFPMSGEQLVEIAATFIAEGLVTTDRVMYFSDGSADAVLERLADDGLPIADALARGQLEIVPADAIGVPTSREELRAQIASSLTQGYRGWRMTGALGHGLRRADGVSLVEYDLGLDAGLAGQPAKVLCIYDQRRYPESVIQAVRAIHRHEVHAPAVYDDALLRITRPGLGRARLAGEVDHSNREAIGRLLFAVLDEVLRSHSAPPSVTVDLSSLRYIDVAGALGIVHAAEHFPSTHRLVLLGARPRVQRVLDRCGAPFASQLDLVVRDRPPEQPEERYRMAAS